MEALPDDILFHLVNKFLNMKTFNAVIGLSKHFHRAFYSLNSETEFWMAFASCHLSEKIELPKKSQWHDVVLRATPICRQGGKKKKKKKKIQK